MKSKKKVSIQDKILVIYTDSQYNKIQLKECSSKKALKEFLADDKKQMCPSGETFSYVVVEGASKLISGSIDRT